MSYDRKIDQVCPHRIVGEALFPAVDRRTVRPLRPVSSISSVEMWANGVTKVPAIGVNTAAEVISPHRGGVDIRAGVNDTLIVSVDHGPNQTLTVPVGKAVSHSQLATVLNRQFSGAFFGVTKRGSIRMATRRAGPAAELVLRDGSTLATTLGLTVNRIWKGRQTYPSWGIIQDPNTLSDRPARMIVFDRKLNGTANFVEINYTTVRQDCRRCRGLGVENDWRYNNKGDVVEARNEALLLQEVLKQMFTVQGSNTFHQWYGTNITNVVAKKIIATGILQSFIVSDIYEAFRRWQNIKKQQEEDIGQFVSDEEYPLRLLSVTIEQSDKDPTIIYVSGTIQNRSTHPIQIDRGIKLPEPVDLLGATAQQGVYRQSLSDYTLTG
jgi:hypothetical protein